MIGWDFRWRISHSVRIADQKQGSEIFAGKHFRFGGHDSTMAHFGSATRSILLRSKNKAASVGVLLYPSLATALLARWRIDSAVRLRWLHHRGKSSPVARRTFLLGRIRGWLFHLVFLRRGGWPYCQQRGPVVPASLAGAMSHVQHAIALAGRAADPAAGRRAVA